MNIMRSISLAFAGLAFVAGLIAAFYWYRSSTISYPSEIHALVPLGGVAPVLAEPLLAALQESGRLNKIAARWSAVAALFAGISTFAGTLM